jgi:transposase
MHHIIMKIFFIIFVHMKRLVIKNVENVRRQILAYLATDDEQIQYLLRLQVILLLSQENGPSSIEVAAIYGIARETVTRWVNKLNGDEKGDIAALLDVPKPGRNTRMSKKLLASIDKALMKPPGKVGIQQDKWTGAVLSDYLKKKYGIELKIRMCQRWIRRLEQRRDRLGKEA